MKSLKDQARNKKVAGNCAVVHDRLISRGGSERVAIAIAEALDAPLYTARYEPEKTFKACRDLNIRDLGGFSEPEISQFYPLIRMLDATKFSGLEELSDYDAVWLSGQWAHFAAKNNLRNIAYVHSPPRFIYDLREHVRERFSQPSRAIFDVWAWFWTSLDQKAAERIGKTVANSENVRRRIQRFYQRDAEIVHPPVDVEKFYRADSENYYLAVNRITPAKGVHIQLDAFQRLPDENLIIVGKAEHGTEYQSEMANRIEKMENIEWIPSVSDEELAELYAHAEATIHTGKDEDFGLSPIESMASGTIPIAVDEGGYKWTVDHGRTGLLIGEPYVKNLVRTINNFDPSLDGDELVAEADKYSKERFIKEIREVTGKIV